MKKLIYITAVLGMLAACHGKGGSANQQQQDTSVVAKSAAVISAQIDENPTDPELYYRRANIYFDEKYLDRSIADIDQAIVLAQDNPIYWFFKGRVLYAMNKTIDAAKAFEKSIALKPDFEDAKMRLAELYYVVKEHKKSLDLYTDVLASNPKNTSALFFKGMNYKEIGDTASAIQVFQKAYEIDASHFDAVMQLGNLYAALQNKIALDYYIAASRLNPKSPEPPYCAGVYFQLKKDYKKAIGMYKQAVKADDKYYQAYYNAALINVEVGDYHNAITALNSVVRLEPGLVDAYYMRGLCYQLLKKNEDAKINFQYTLDLNPKHELAKQALAKLK